MSGPANVGWENRLGGGNGTQDADESARADPRSGRLAWLKRGAPAICVVCMVISCGGSHRRHKPSILVTKANAGEYIRVALEDDDPDARRRAIDRLAHSRHLNRTSSVDALDVIARTDPSERVRCRAVRAMANVANPKGVETMLAILDASGERRDVRPAGDELRWHAVEALERLITSTTLAAATSELVHDTAINLLERDPSRAVRIGAAKLLGYCPTRPASRALVSALSAKDFGIVYEAERSLTRLTGQTHDHSPAAWTAWLERTDDPFLDRGHSP